MGDGSVYRRKPELGAFADRALRQVQHLVGAVGELLVPPQCPGCGGTGEHVEHRKSGGLCPQCKVQLQQVPRRFSPRASLRAPAWTCGPYAGAHRGIILSAKERGSRRAREIMGAVIGAALGNLAAVGVIMPPLITPIVLIPAPTRRGSARRRGGDPVTLACEFAAATMCGVEVLSLVQTQASTKDSAELGASQRRANLSGRILPNVTAGSEKHAQLRQLCESATVVLVDDVATTGATASETELVLASLGVRLDLVLVVSRA